MPLSHKLMLSALDADTQTLLSAIYVELSARASARLDGHADDARNKVADELLRLAYLGERDSQILKAKAIKASGYDVLAP
jgi:hypothetical protein